MSEESHEGETLELTIKSKRKQGNGVQCLLCKTSFQNLHLLKCLHFFCKLCLESKFRLQLSRQLDIGNESFLFSCPLCDFPQNVGNESNSVDEILNGIHESQLLSAINEQENALLGTSVCLPCKNRNKDSFSVCWCYECRSNLCENCLAFHISMPTLVSHKTYTKNEVLDKIDLISSAREICEYHILRLRIFCSTHKIACCNTCIVDNHRSCHLIDLKTHANSQKDSVEPLRISFRKLYSELEDAMHKNMVEQELIEEFTQNNSQGVKDTYESWRRHSLSLTDDLTAETYKLFYHEMQMYETKAGAQKRKVALLENCKDVLNVSLSSSDVRIFLEMIKVQKIYTDVMGFFKHQNKPSFPLSAQLTVDQTFNMLPVLDSFGRIQSKKNPKQLSCSVSFSIEEDDSHVTGCDWVSEDTFIVVDVKTREQHRFGQSNVRIYNLQGEMLKKINFHRTCKPHDVVVLDNGNAAITVPNMREVRIYNLQTRHIIEIHSTEINCYGICKLANDTLVTAGEGKILFINTSGEVIKSVSVSGQDIRYVCAVSNDLLFYSSLQDNRVYSVLGNGKEIYCFQNTKGAAGLFIDDKRNAHVCEKGSNVVTELDESGNFQTSIEVGLSPTAIAYSEKYGKICVIRGGRHRKNTAIIYSYM